MKEEVRTEGSNQSQTCGIITTQPSSVSIPSSLTFHPSSNSLTLNRRKALSRGGGRGRGRNESRERWVSSGVDQSGPGEVRNVVVSAAQGREHWA